MPRNDPTMTRRHFELIAGVINALDLSKTGAATSVPTQELRLHIAHDFSRCLEASNVQFNREAFINACTQSDRARAEKLTKRANPVKTLEKKSSGLSPRQEHLSSDPNRGDYEPNETR